MPTAAGQLKDRVAFERRAEVDDGYGNAVSGSWETFYECAARLRPLKGGEEVQAARLEGKQPAIVTVRRCAQALQVDTDCRVRDTRTDRVYAVTAPPADMEESRAFLDILVMSGVAA